MTHQIKCFLYRGFPMLLGVFLLATALQAQEFKTGCILDPVSYEKVPLAAPLMRGDFDRVPTFVSLRPYTPLPQNQGSLGTCVGWSIAYAARTILAAYEQKWTNQVLITENAFSPFFLYEQAKSIKDIYCMEGTSLYNALEIIKEVGVVKINDFGNQCGMLITSQHEKKATENKIKDYRRLFESNSGAKAHLVKKSLSQNRPVVIGIQCCAESFLNAKGVDFWKLQPKDNPNPDGGHALTVIGYDDNYNGGAFELMNSWGTTWGKQGYIWMSYKDFEKYCFEAYEMTTPPKEGQTVSGKLKFTLTSDKAMDAVFKGTYYEMKETYRSGTLFRLQISNNEPAYVYAFTSDLTKKNNQIFPLSDKISPYLAYKGNNVAIPDEDHYLQMDDTKGTDYFCVLYSLEKLDLTVLMQEMEKTEGTFQQRLQYALGSKMVSPRDIFYQSNGEIGFKAYPKNKTVIPLIVTLNHQ